MSITDLLKKIDPRDVICLIGISMLGTGLWWVEPWISLVSVGSLLIVLSILPDVVAFKNKGR